MWFKSYLKKLKISRVCTKWDLCWQSEHSPCYILCDVFRPVRDKDNEMLYLASSSDHASYFFFFFFPGSPTLLILSLWLWLGRRSLKSLLNGWRQQGRSHHELFLCTIYFNICKLVKYWINPFIFHRNGH